MTFDFCSQETLKTFSHVTTHGFDKFAEVTKEMRLLGANVAAAVAGGRAFCQQPAADPAVRDQATRKQREDRALDYKLAILNGKVGKESPSQIKENIIKVAPDQLKKRVEVLVLEDMCKCGNDFPSHELIKLIIEAENHYNL